MKYLLDSNTVSAFMRGDAAVNARLSSSAPADVLVSQPSLAEVMFGIARLPDSRRKQWLQDSFALVMATITRAHWSDAVSQSFASIKSSLEKRGEPLEDFDIAIAAHAMAEGATLVTSNRKHFQRIRGLTIEDWTGDANGAG